MHDEDDWDNFYDEEYYELHPNGFAYTCCKATIGSKGCAKITHAPEDMRQMRKMEKMERRDNATVLAEKNA